MDACCIIPYRGDSEARPRNLELVLRNLDAVGFDEIIVVEHGPHAAADHTAARNVRSLHIPADGSFNKAAAINRGALATEAGVLVIADADVIVDPAVLAACVQACGADFDAISPYETLIDLDEAATRKLWNGTQPDPATIGSASVNRRGQGEHLCFCGGVYVIRRETYVNVGGNDERFIGWGGEDDAMSIKLERLGGRIATNRSQPAFHLWHPRAHAHTDREQYRRNVALVTQYRTASEQELRALAAEQARRLTGSNPGPNRG